MVDQDDIGRSIGISSEDESLAAMRATDFDPLTDSLVTPSL